MKQKIFLTKHFFTIIFILALTFSILLLISGCATQKQTDTKAVQPSSQSEQSSNTVSSQVSGENTAVTIIIKNFAFTPSSMTVKAGTTVKWINQDSENHLIKSDKINSEVIGSGQAFEFKFEEKGTYDYICGIHPSMKGRVIVQ